MRRGIGVRRDEHQSILVESTVLADVENCVGFSDENVFDVLVFFELMDCFDSAYVELFGKNSGDSFDLAWDKYLFLL